MGPETRSRLAPAHSQSTFPCPPAPTRHAGLLGASAVCPRRQVPGDRGLRAGDGEGPSCPSGDTMQFLEGPPGPKPCRRGWSSGPAGQGPAGPRSSPAVRCPDLRRAPCLGTRGARWPLPVPPPPQKARELSGHVATGRPLLRLLSGQRPAVAHRHLRPASWGPTRPGCPAAPGQRAALGGLLHLEKHREALHSPFTRSCEYF